MIWALIGLILLVPVVVLIMFIKADIEGDFNPTRDHFKRINKK